MQIAATGMQAAFKRLDVAAHDIANATTPNYGHYTPHQSDRSPNGTALDSLSRSSAPTELAHEFGEALSSKHSNAANAKAFKVQDRMVGALLDIFA
jgi:flagellar hook-associated protein FlgK